jgi:hypothetical protein
MFDIPLPPIQYDHAYSGKLTVIISHAQKDRYCGRFPVLACAYPNGRQCTVILPPAYSQRLWRHEIGHCNGWAADHPGADYYRR